MKKILLFIILNMSINIFCVGQTIWTGEVSNDWSDASNWDDGLPGLTNDAVIPSGGTPEISGAAVANHLTTVEASATLVILNSGTLFNEVTLHIENGGNLTNQGTLTSNELINEGTFINVGTLNILEFGLSNSGTMNNEGNIFINQTSFINNSGTLNNSGELTNVDGSIVNHNLLNNLAIINTSYEFINASAGIMTNSGVLNNTNTGMFSNEGNMTNSGIVSNSALFYNQGPLTNTFSGEWSNNSILDNSSHYFNFGNFFNTPNGDLINGAIFENSGVLNNLGYLSGMDCITNACGLVIQNSNGSDFLLSGIGQLSILQGTVNESPFFSCEHIETMGLICSADTTVDYGTSTNTSTLGFATGCGDISYSDSIVTGECPAIDTIYRTWRESIMANNALTTIDSCRQTITILSEINFICPADLIIQLEIGECDSSAVINTPRVFGDCNNISDVVQTSGPSDGDLLETGNYTVSFDLIINEIVISSCSYNIRVNTYTGPVSDWENLIADIFTDDNCLSTIYTSDLIENGSPRCSNDYILEIDGVGLDGVNVNGVPIALQAGNVYLVRIIDPFTPDTSFAVADIRGNALAEFTQLGPYCLNEMPDILPTTSLSGSGSGSWDGPILTTEIGTTIYTFTPNNPDVCSTTMTIEVVSGVFECPRDTVINLNAGDCSHTATILPLELEVCESNAEIIQTCGPENGDNLEPGIYQICFDLLINGVVDQSCSYSITVNEYTGPVNADLYCNHELTLELNTNCQVTIYAENLLVEDMGPYMCYDEYIVQVEGLNGDVNGVPIDLISGFNYMVYLTDPNTGNSCFSNVIIEEPEIICPPDLIVDCSIIISPEALNNNDLNNPYGRIDFDTCFSILSVNSLSPVDCGDFGTRFYSRIFTIQDQFGETIQCTQRLYLTEPTFSICDTEPRCAPIDDDFSSVCISGGHTDQDNVEWPCDLTLDGCTFGTLPWQLNGSLDSDVDINGVPIKINAYPRYDNTSFVDGEILGTAQVACSKIAIDSSDQFIHNEIESYIEILRTWTVIDSCQFDAVTRDPNDPARFLGLWTYGQSIKVMNVSVLDFETPDQTDFCDEDGQGRPFNVLDCLVDVELTSGLIELGQPNPNLIHSWQVDYFTDGSIDEIGQGTFVGPVPQTHPNGLSSPGNAHTIYWTITDACSLESTTQYTFTAIECKRPTPFGVNSFPPFDFSGSACVTIQASDLDQGSFDNCTPKNELEFLIGTQRSDNLDEFSSELTLCCNDIALGTTEISLFLYVVDNVGNFDNFQLDVSIIGLPSVELTTLANLCADAGLQTDLSGGFPLGGVYSGIGITDLGNGIGYDFDPSENGVGAVTVTYTFTTDNGCTYSTTSDIDIIDCGVEITDPCNCLDNATVIDLDDGTGGDDGQFSEIISIADATGGILPPGQSWTVVGAIGAFDAYNVPAIGVQSAGVPVAIDGSVTLTYNGQTGVYELPFVHIDAIGYSIMIEGPFPMGSAANLTLAIANNCAYPDPLFDPALTDEYCPSDPMVALGGTDQNGVGADAIMFTIDGMPETMLDPSTLSVGSHTVVMTFDGADDSNGGVSPDGGTTPASPGCIQTIQKVISVIVGQNPIIVCPADTTIDCGSDTSPSTLGMATATDDCGNGVSVTSSDMVVMGVCPAVDTIFRAWSASDGANGMITCLQTIIVQDTIAPIFNVRTLPQDTIIDCEALPAAVLTATDECDPNMVITATLDEQVVPGECPVIDTIYRTWTAVDGCGNAVVHMQTIVVQDTTLPTFDTQPMSLMDIACDDPLPMQETLTATDNCGNVTVTPSVEMTGDVCLGRTVTYKWIADDGCNVDSVETTFNILPDADPPVFDQAIPNDTTIDCTEMIPAAAMITATDGCSGIGMPVTLMEATLSGVCAAQDTIRRIWSTADGCANAVQDTQFIFMIDDAQPTFTSPADVTIDCEVNPTDLSATGDVTDVMDACGMSNVTFIDDIDLSGCGGYTGTVTRMWTVSDDCGNDTMFNQIITVQDTTPPTFTVPADITLAGHQDPYDLMTTGDVTDAADNCGQVVVDYTNVEDLDASGTGTITRTWTATDDCDNETVMVQVITIITCALTCPGDVILNLEAGECYEVASIIQPTITGDCADVIIPDTTMGFVDAFDPGNASLILNDVCGGVDLSGIPGTLSLTSSDICGTDPVGCSGQAQQNDCAFVATLISFTAPTDGLFSFDWDYLNSDNVSDDNDNFGYAVGDVNTLTFGQVTQLNAGVIFVDDPAAQNGSEVDIPVSAGQDIVFIIYDFSGCCGTATADITNFIFVEIPVQVYEIVQSCGPMDGDLLEPGTYEVCFDLLFGGMVDTTCSYNITVNEYAGPVETDLICNGALNLSIDSDCMVTIRADDLLEGGPYMCYDDYEITLAEHPALGDVNGVSINLPPGTSVTATVTDPNTGNSCWVTLNIEYKFPPQLQCPCEDPIFDLDGVLETTDASVDFSALACTNPVTTFDGLTTYDVAVFSITNAGDFTFEMAGLGDGLAYLFEGVFDGTCSATLVEGDDDNGVGLNPRIEASLAPGTYSLVSTHTTFNTTLGAYTWTVTAEIAGCDNTCEDFDAFIADPSLGGAPAFVGGCTTVEDYTFTDVVDEQLCETSTVTRTFIVTDNLGNTASCVAVYEFISTGSFDFPADLDGIDNDALQCDEYCGNVSGGWAYHYDDEYPGLKIPSPDADGNCPGSGRPGGSGCDFIQSAYWDHIIPVCDLQYGQDQAAYWGTYKIVRHWIISNWCTGEVEEMNQLIKIEDNDPPVVTCPDDVTVGVTGHDCDRDLMRLPYPEVEDGCGHAYATPYVHTAEGEEVVPGPYFDSRDRLYAEGEDWFVKDLPLGHNLAKWIATDGCNNYDTCEYYIIVEDLTPPVAVCESFRQVSLTEDGYAKIFAEAFDDGSNDNCGPVYFKVLREIIGGCDRINGDDSPAPGYQEWYDDYAKFCCEDVGEPVIVRLRVYDVDPGLGPVSPSAYAGHWNECWSEVTVEDKLPPAISCPPDMTVSCDNDLLLSDLENNDVDNPYGYAIGFDNCDVEITVRAAEPVDCGSDNRFFTRTFTARDPDGRTARCTQRIYLIEDPFTICDTESRCEPLQSLNVACRSGGHTNRDNAEWPCDLVLEECGLGLDPWQLAANPANARDANGNRIALNAYPRYDNAGPLNGQILGIYPYACAQIAIDSSDQVFTLVEDACLKILRTWTVIDWCQFDAITRDPDDPDRFVGYWEYIQIIKVRNTVGPTFNDPGQTDFCDESTPDCLVSVTLTSGAEDDCTPTDHLHYAWAVDYFSDGSYDLTGNGPTFSRRVEQSHPYGLNGPGTPHTIRWTVEDGCDNTTVNEYTFTAVECKKPTPYCDNGIAIVVMPSSGSIAVWANDLDAGSFDNCTEQENLIFTIRKIVDGEPVGIPTPSLTLDCSCMPNGVSETINVEIWVEDEAGNRDNCDTYILLQDTPDGDMPEGICPDDNPVPLVSGTIATEEGVSAPLHEVQLLDADDQIVEVDFTNVSGEYAFGSLGGAFVRPVNNLNPSEGLSTLDLIAIQRHILGIELFDSPYKMIAGDVTMDENMNVLDLLEIQELILGLRPEFANTDSWVYVSGSEEMDISNPYTFETPKSIVSYTDQDNLVEDFVAVKKGDVNGTAIAGVAGIVERSGLVLEVNDAKVTYGEEIRVPVTSSNFTSIDGYQFTMDFDQSSLTFVRIESGALTINAENVGIHTSGKVATNWYNEKAETVAADEVLFTLVFQGESIKGLTINGDVTSAESYRNGQIQSVNLVFNGNTAETFALYQNEPNPFVETTTVMFDLPSAAAATLTVFDVNGKTLMIQDIDGQTGYNEYVIKKSHINNATGVMYYRVDTDDYTATKKMISIK